MSTDAVTLYRRDVARLAAGRGSEILDHLPLVLHLAWKYRRRDIDLADLIQAGNEGLLLAQRNFDRTRGTFGAYAHLWIQDAIFDELGSHHQMSIPR